MIIESRKTKKRQKVSEQDWEKLKELGLHRNWSMISRDDSEEIPLTKAIPQEITEYSKEEFQPDTKIIEDPVEEVEQQCMPERDPDTLEGLRDLLDANGIKYPSNYKENGLRNLAIKHKLITE